MPLNKETKPNQSIDFYLFHSLQNALNEKTFSQEDQVKNVCGETSWAQNQQNFTWDESISYLINGKEVIQNDGKYTID